MNGTNRKRGFLAILSVLSIIYSTYQQPVVVMEKNESRQNEKVSEKVSKEVEEEKHTEYKEEKKIWENNKELLVLVNKENACPKEGFSLRKICNGRLLAADILYSDLCRMLEDAGDEGYQFWIASAYRSAERQQELVDEDVQSAMRKGMSYEEALEKTYEETMPSGYSEHQTGLALDILSTENTKMDISQENTLGNQWLREHCYEYGFILRYPKDKEEITDISYEPWHFRYVGKKAAEYMKDHQLTLEEFYLRLQNES